MAIIPGQIASGGSAAPATVRKKSECYFPIANITIPTTETNLINLLKNELVIGSFDPFFDTNTNQFNVFNVDATCTFKINLVGSWSGSSSNRSMTVSFPGTTGNTLVASRDAAVTEDIISLATFFSVDKDGNLATNGSDITIKSNGGVFIAREILLIAEQMVPKT